MLLSVLVSAPPHLSSLPASPPTRFEVADVVQNPWPQHLGDSVVLPTVKDRHKTKPNQTKEMAATSFFQSTAEESNSQCVCLRKLTAKFYLMLRLLSKYVQSQGITRARNENEIADLKVKY